VQCCEHTNTRPPSYTASCTVDALWVVKHAHRLVITSWLSLAITQSSSIDINTSQGSECRDTFLLAGYLMVTLLLISCWVCQWKNVNHLPVVMIKTLCGRFKNSQCIILKYSQSLCLKTRVRSSDACWYHVIDSTRLEKIAARQTVNVPDAVNKLTYTVNVNWMVTGRWGRFLSLRRLSLAKRKNITRKRQHHLPALLHKWTFVGVFSARTLTIHTARTEHIRGKMKVRDVNIPGGTAL